MKSSFQNRNMPLFIVVFYRIHTFYDMNLLTKNLFDDIITQYNMLLDFGEAFMSPYLYPDTAQKVYQLYHWFTDHMNHFHKTKQK